MTRPVVRRHRRYGMVAVGSALLLLATQAVTVPAAAGAGASAKASGVPAAARLVSASVPVPSPPVQTAFSQARLSGSPVEVQADRTATSDTYALPNGNFESTSSVTPINYQTGSSTWAPINNDLTADTSPGFSAKNTAGPYTAEFPATLASPVSFSEGSASIGFSLAGATGTLSTQANLATYTSALPGVTVSYATSGSGLGETLSLASAAAPAAYVFHLTTSTGVTLVPSGSDIDVVQAGATIAVLPAPSMADSAGVSGTVAETLTGTAATGWTLTYTPSAVWLADAARAFPVTVDPTVVAQTASNTCAITNYTPTTSNCNNNGGTVTVGATTEGGSTLYKMRELVGVSLPTIPRDALIIEADMTASDSNSSEIIQAEPVSQVWTTQATWNNAQSGVAWTTAGGSTVSGYTASGYTANGQTAVTGGTEYDWYVTKGVQDWLTDQSYPGVTGIVNNGFLLQSTSEGTNQTVGVHLPVLNIEWQQRAGDEPGLHYNKTSLDDQATFGLEPANGNGQLTTKILDIPGVGENLGINSYYNSWSGDWTLNAGADVNAGILGDGSVIYADGTGATSTYVETTGVVATCQAGSLTFTTFQQYPANTNGCAHDIGSGTSTGTVYLVNPDTSGFTTYGGTANAYESTNILRGDGALGDYLVTAKTDRNGNTISYAYNTSHQLTSITDTEGHVFTVTPSTADPAEPATIAGPTGATGANYRTWQFSWATNGALNSYTDAAGQTTHYYYDTNGHLSEVLAPGTTAATTESTFTTGTEGEIHSFTQDDPTSLCPSGACTTNFFSVHADQPTTQGSDTCTTYQGAGYTYTQPTTMIGCSTYQTPNGNTTAYGWTSTDGIVKTVDPNNVVTGAAFDPTTGQPTSSTDALGNTSLSTFNSNLDAVSTTAPASASGQTAAVSDLAYTTPGGPHNAGELPSTSVDANGHCTTMAYDTNGNLTSTWTGVTATGSGTGRACATPGGPTAGESNTIKTYKGDAGTSGCTAKTGELCSTETPNGNTTTDTYNTLGQLTTVTPPTPAQPTTYTYDANGRVQTVTDGAGRTTTYTYDGDDRVVAANYNAAGDPTCSNAATCVTYTFDPNGNELSQTNGTGTTTFAYSPRNQVTAETVPGAATRTCGTFNDAAIHYTYDNDSHLASYCDAGGTVNYNYNTLDQLIGVADPGGTCTGTVVQPCTTYSYDLAGRPLKTTLPTGTGSVQCEGYDNAGNLLNLVATDGTCTTAATGGTVTATGTLQTSLTYSYNTGTADTGIKQSVVDNIRGLTTTYGYNGQTQLTSATYSGSSADQWLYTYDLDGNIQTVKLPSTPLATNTFNADDQQKVGTTYPYNGAGDQTTTPTNTALTYNTLDQTNTDTPSGGSSNPLTYLGTGQAALASDGTTTLQDSTLGVTASTTGGTTVYFTRTPGGTLESMRTGSSTHYYLQDANGTTVGLLNSSGTKTAAYVYDPYGNLTNGTPTGIAATNPFRYNSGYQTSSGLYHYAARYYDPTAGRWTQLDPSGQNPGYEYAGDNPANESDSSGLDCTEPQCVYPSASAYDAATPGGFGFCLAGLAELVTAVFIQANGVYAGQVITDLGSEEVTEVLLATAAGGPIGAAGAGALIVVGAAVASC